MGHQALYWLFKLMLWSIQSSDREDNGCTNKCLIINHNEEYFIIQDAVKVRKWEPNRVGPFREKTVKPEQERELTG